MLRYSVDVPITAGRGDGLRGLYAPRFFSSGDFSRFLPQENNDAYHGRAKGGPSKLGLDCVGTLGQGYLVPYYNSKIKAYECQFIAGYQGLIELARRSGNIARIESRVVYEKDAFEVEYGLNQKLVHQISEKVSQ